MRHSVPKLCLIDLDGSLPDQPALWNDADAVHIDLRAQSPRIRMGCSWACYHKLTQILHNRLPDDAVLACFGSGDFHHVTLSLLQRIDEPFNLVIFDKHPDWMRGIPIIHCGTWVAHAANLPTVRKIFHFGGDMDFDNAWRHFAPWRMLAEGRIITLPARRRFTRGRWRGISTYPLNQWTDEVEARLSSELGGFPLYISIDKDVLSADEAAVNWDSAYMSLQELSTWVQRVLEWSHWRGVGADLLGDFSPVRISGPLRRFLHLTEHPATRPIDAAAAARLNQHANQTLLSILRQMNQL